MGNRNGEWKGEGVSVQGLTEGQEEGKKVIYETWRKGRLQRDGGTKRLKKKYD